MNNFKLLYDLNNLSIILHAYGWYFPKNEPLFEYIIN